MSDPIYWVAIVVAGVAAVLVWRVLAPGLDRGVSRALAQKDPDALVRAILAMGRPAQPDAFNHAIRRLWDAYERPLAIPVIKALVEHHDESPIAQYWLDLVQGVEPELAREAIGRDFFEAHFRPQVAACCGDSGG